MSTVLLQLQTDMGSLAVVLACVVLMHSSSAGGANYDRQQKFFPILGFGYGPGFRIANTPCVSENNLNGTCASRKDCGKGVGVASGTCSRGLGVCCVVVKSCGQTSSVNTTYFTNQGYPSAYKGGGRCSVTIKKLQSVTQLRLDFLELSLSQPDANGFCRRDFLSVNGGSFPLPRICGANIGGHVYVDIPQNTPSVVVSVDTDDSTRFSRAWNILITQIESSNPSRAPPGCLQYYQSVTGQVSSFNYGTVPNTNHDQTPYGTREMANLDYSVCVRAASGYCSILWSQPGDDPFSFTVSGDTAGLDETVLGSSDAALNGSDCDGDFVVIPNPFHGTSAVNNDRFCGNAFLPTISSIRPFILGVVTNNTEQGSPTQLPDVGNRGFRLDFRQLPCPL